ncbi:MAG: YfiR family protein [Planctomycetes bacterium]|nr:YfiR family protein [Planctomycetota bacterium]
MTRNILLTLIVCGVWLATSVCNAQTPVKDERQVKATYLYFFSQYGTWPENAVPDAQGQFIVGLLGPDPFGGYFDALKGKTVAGGKIKIEIRRFESSNDYKPCHLVFISPEAADNGEGTAEQRLAGLLKKRNPHVMIVSDSPGLATAGAMINNFIAADGRVHLEINRAEMQKQGLDMSPKVLQLSIVHLVP